jgi:N utilization substance protein B
MGTRRKAREAALKILFEQEYNNIDFSVLVERLEDEDRNNPDFRSFLDLLLKTYATHHKAVDHKIEEHSEHWKLSRMPTIDRNILRLGITELVYLAEIPKSVTINEYLEIAKKFGTEDSSGFVNGLLDKFEKQS